MCMVILTNITNMFYVAICLKSIRTYPSTSPVAPTGICVPYSLYRIGCA